MFSGGFSTRQSGPARQYEFINVNACFFVLFCCLGSIPSIQTNASLAILACFQIVITHFAPRASLRGLDLQLFIEGRRKKKNIRQIPFQLGPPRRVQPPGGHQNYGSAPGFWEPSEELTESRVPFRPRRSPIGACLRRAHVHRQAALARSARTIIIAASKRFLNIT